MQRWILLLRGINVGGKNILPMKDLVRDLQALGLEGVQTYIQSGNAVFESPASRADLSEQIASAIEDRHGFRPSVLLLSAEQLQDAIASNPFRQAEAEPKTLHLFFLASVPANPDIDLLNELRSPSERFHLCGRVFYLHAPDGIGRSKLAAKVEKALGVRVTARNWRTVQKLHEMAKA